MYFQFRFIYFSVVIPDTLRVKGKVCQKYVHDEWSVFDFINKIYPSSGLSRTNHVSLSPCLSVNQL